MTERTAKSLNALLHGINLVDFHPSDQAGLEGVLLDYFTVNSSDSDLSDDEEMTIM